MVQTLQIHMNRHGSSAWGFRLHGGADFGSPLIIQKVNYQSPSASAGLQVGDVILALNGHDVSGCRHKEAQEFIMKAGNNFQLTIQRDGLEQQVWKPKVTPVGVMPTKPTAPGQVFTKTSLASNKKEDDQHWDVKYNQTAKGFSTCSSSSSSSKHHNEAAKNMHHQYNSPIKLYSEQAINDILNQQAETLASGVKGINFSKPELVKDTNVPDELIHSETLRMVRDMDKHKNGFNHEDHTGFRSVAAPVTNPNQDHKSSSGGPPLTTCAKCQRLITGVFCKVKDQPLHAECFTCDFCKCQLKNTGYFSIGDKLYCEPHARAAKASEQQSGQTAPPKTNVAPGYGNGCVNQHGTTTTFNKNHNQEHWEQQNAKTAKDFTKNFNPPMFGSNFGSKLPMATSTSAYLAKQPDFAAANQQPRESFLNNSLGKLDNTSSLMKSKKAGGSFQWPPVPKDEEENSATATPIYINPNQSGSMGQTEIPSPNFLSKTTTTTSTSTSAHYQSHQTEESVQHQHQKRPTTSGGLQSILKNPSSSSASSVNPLAAESDSFLNAEPGQNMTAPKRGIGVLKEQLPGMRVPVCGACHNKIRGPFITALGRTWCPSHFICSKSGCGRSLQDTGFVEEQDHLYCEDCFAKYLAPDCDKCNTKILGNCLKAMGKTFHPECFVCAYCGKMFANSPFYLEDNLPYCEEDYNELFTTKCVSCGFPIEAGDRWVEALNSNYHSQCFNCTLCKKNLEGQGFFVKAGKPFCKSHARLGV